MGPSTQNLAALPAPAELRRLLQALAVLDLIVCEEWQYRYYSYDAQWDAGEELGAMRNGSGDDFHVVFSKHGVVIKGFGHESSMTPWYPDADNPKVHPGVLDATPADLLATIDVALAPEITSFCIWRTHEDTEWRIGPIQPDPTEMSDPDGSVHLLEILDGRPETYCEYATDYFERDVPLEAVRRVYGHEPLSQELVSAFDPARKLTDLVEELTQIGYPIQEVTG